MSEEKETPETEINAEEPEIETQENEPEPSKSTSSTSAGNSDGDSENSRFIKLKVVGNDQNGIHFRLKLTTQLLKLKKSYSAHVGVPVSGLRFLFDGKRISDSDTPKQLDMRDDDQIEVYHEQTGGILSNQNFILRIQNSRKRKCSARDPLSFYIQFHRKKATTTSLVISS